MYSIIQGLTVLILYINKPQSLASDRSDDFPCTHVLLSNRRLTFYFQYIFMVPSIIWQEVRNLPYDRQLGSYRLAFSWHHHAPLRKE